MLELDDLLADPRFDTVGGRAEHSLELTTRISEALKRRPRDEWLGLMRGARLYVAKVNQIEDLVDDEQVAANQFIVEREDGFKTVPMPFSMDGYSVPLAAPPALGSFKDVRASVLS
jgi:crotonobetainyl-CoA:carnitine CoA-transferase CaiB-like acyl-CoA transferase